MKKYELVFEEDETTIFATDNKAVRFVFGYSTGSETGPHNFLDTYALAEVGLWEDGEFVEINYTKEDAPNKAMIGQPKEYDGWNPENLEEIAWGAYGAWMDNFCKEVFEG